MTLEQAQRLRVGDVISNSRLPGYVLAVMGSPQIAYGVDTIPAITQWKTMVDSFVSLSTLVKRNIPDHMALPLGA